MRQTLVVADDFYDDFAAVRQLALSSEYETTRTGRYPGRNSRHPHLSDEALQKLSFIVGGPIAWTTVNGTGHFRASPAVEARELDVHFDSAQLSAIVYLNSAEQCAGRIGTSFWRHRRTGAIAAPRGAEARNDFMRDVIVPDSLDRSRWELQMQVNLAPNRLVVFQSSLLHSASEDFGSGLEDARLIQVFFLERR